jgi:hypothetical protein
MGIIGVGSLYLGIQASNEVLGGLTGNGMAGTELGSVSMFGLGLMGFHSVSMTSLRCHQRRSIWIKGQKKAFSAL